MLLSLPLPSFYLAGDIPFILEFLVGLTAENPDLF
jgi:hypothetical protein